MLPDFSHLQMIRYDVQIGDRITPKVAIFNCNKLPTGVATRCIETDTFNNYLLTMTQEQFQALFLDDDAEAFSASFGGVSDATEGVAHVPQEESNES